MTDQDRADQISARVAAATPRPWSLWNGWGPIGAGEHEGLMGVERLGPLSGESVVQHNGPDMYVRREDAEFIANAPDDLAWLLEQRTALLTRVEAAERAGEKHVHNWRRFAGGYACRTCPSVCSALSESPAL